VIHHRVNRRRWIRLTLAWIAPLNGMIRIKQARWVE